MLLESRQRLPGGREIRGDLEGPRKFLLRFDGAADGEQRAGEVVVSHEVVGLELRGALELSGGFGEMLLAG